MTNASIGIIHGDVKPQNILIFKDDSGNYVAKVADFGYSTQFVNDEELVKMPKSWPWNAPEHHHRGFKPSQARKMDAYSFGILCLWLMFKEKIFEVSANSRNAFEERDCGFLSHKECHEEYAIEEF